MTAVKGTRPLERARVSILVGGFHSECSSGWLISIWEGLTFLRPDQSSETFRSCISSACGIVCPAKICTVVACAATNDLGTLTAWLVGQSPRKESSLAWRL
jgi:hypothetical protein